MAILSRKRQVTLPKELCARLLIQPGDSLSLLEHGGRITIIKKIAGSSDGRLSHLKGRTKYCDEESLQDTSRKGGGRAAKAVLGVTSIETNALLRGALNGESEKAEKARKSLDSNPARP